MRFAGYAAVFDRIDRGGDVIRPGAFARVPKAVPLLWEHGRRIGSVERIAEDGRGLQVIGTTDRAVAAGTGLSIGYRVRSARDRSDGRELLTLDLIEVSLVRFPMQVLAQVIAVEGPKGSSVEDQSFNEEKMMDSMTGSLEASFEAMTLAPAIERPALSGARSTGAHEAFVDGYLRRGSDVELKSFSGAAAGDGGFAVPRELDAVIDRTLTAISPLRRIANVVRVGSAGYRKLVTTNGTPSGWASEAGARAETATPSFKEIAPPMGELFANPAASQAMLDDAAFDVEGWLAGEIATEFARAEGTAFVTGDGVNKPRGFLTGTHTNEGDGTRAFGTLQYLATGSAGAFPASNPQDRLIDLIQTLRTPYRQGAAFVMNSATLARIRKFKTTDGAFLWQPSMASGQPDSLLGYPVIEAEEMPDIAPDSYAIAFGNFGAGYLIAERSETSILRDPFTHKPFVHFYAVKRIGGAVTNSEAIKLLKFAAS